jgi:hypothetical protein
MMKFEMNTSTSSFNERTQFTNLRQRIKTTNPLAGVQNSSKSHLGDLMNWAKSSREVPSGPDDIFYSISSTSSTQLTN